MKNVIVTMIALLVAAALMFTQAGCKKENQQEDIIIQDPQTADFSVSLQSTISSRSSYESVSIDIQKVSIHTSTDSTETSGWFDLETNIGIYDLLNYDAGNDTIIALDPVMEAQTVSQIRLLLGTENTVVDGGITNDLEIPSAQSSGLKIQVHAELQPNTSYKVVLDFDPDNSVKKVGTGGINDFKYMLKPVIKATVIAD